jgi:hypothetical protein
MNRQHWKELLPFITAFANGERVETQEGGGWVKLTEPRFQGRPETYRIAPRTIRIGAFDVPEPYRGEMKMGQEYYYPASDQLKSYHVSTWDGHKLDPHRMKRGLIHLTPEAAALHGKALASLTAGEGVDL